MMSIRIGVDIGGTKIEALALDTAGREILRRRIPTPRGDYPATLAAVAGLVREIGDGTVGIGIPGALSRATGRVKNANSTWLIGRSLKEDLERALKREIRLENDANCFALSEAVDGAGQGARGGFGVILGTRGGRGIVVDGRLLDPDVIVLGGGMSNIERLYGEVPRLWGRHVFSDRVTTRLARHAHGDSSGVRGAAWLWPSTR